MITCHCNRISVAEIEETIRELLSEEAYQLIVPLQVYHRLAKRGRCCNCFPAVVDIIVRVTAEFHEELQTPNAEIVDLVARLKIQHATVLKNKSHQLLARTA